MKTVSVGFARNVGLSTTPEDAPTPEVRRGYVEVPTYDVQKYVGERLTTFGMGALLGFSVGTAVTVFFMRRDR